VPESLITPIPPRPDGVEIATIVSSNIAPPSTDKLSSIKKVWQSRLVLLGSWGLPGAIAFSKGKIFPAGIYAVVGNDV
jgi:hypothetical protein